MGEEGEQNRKLFLGGLNYATTEESLTSYFNQWGTLVDVVVMRFPDSRRSRGFGFITYSSEDEAELCVQSGPHSVDGTKVDLKRATPKGERAESVAPKADVVCKIFVGGLNPETTDDSLRSYFEQFGEVTDCIVMKHKDTDRSRGFGFVTYSSTDMVDAVQQNRPHTIDGSKVETKRATPRDDVGKQDAGQKVNKIFVGGLKDPITDEALQEYFGQFGNVVSATHLTDKTTGRKRGFGFVEFDDHDPVDKVIQIPRHQINGMRVDIRKAVNRNEGSQGNFGGYSYGGGRGGGRGGGAQWGGGQGGYGGGGYGGGYGDDYSSGAGGWGGAASGNPWQSSGGSWGDQGNSWGSNGASGGGYMTAGGGWGGGYGSGNAGMSGGGGAMRSAMGANRSAPYPVGGRGGPRGGGYGGAARGGRF